MNKKRMRKRKRKTERRKESGKPIDRCWNSTDDFGSRRPNAKCKHKVHTTQGRNRMNKQHWLVPTAQEVEATVTRAETTNGISVTVHWRFYCYALHWLASVISSILRLLMLLFSDGSSSLLPLPLRLHRWIAVNRSDLHSISWLLFYRPIFNHSSIFSLFSFLFSLSRSLSLFLFLLLFLVLVVVLALFLALALALFLFLFLFLQTKYSTWSHCSAVRSNAKAQVHSIDWTTLPFARPSRRVNVTQLKSYQSDWNRPDHWPIQSMKHHAVVSLTKTPSSITAKSGNAAMLCHSAQTITTLTTTILLLINNK